MARPQGWAKSRRTFLQSAYPKQYKKMEKDGTLEPHLTAVGEAASEMYDSIWSAENSRNPPGEYFMDKIKRLEQVPLIADEMVKADLIHAPL